MKVLIAYFSLSGKTEKMAEYIAEGIRFSGREVVVKKMGDIKAVARRCVVSDTRNATEPRTIFRDKVVAPGQRTRRDTAQSGCDTGTGIRTTACLRCVGGGVCGRGPAQSQLGQRRARSHTHTHTHTPARASERNYKSTLHEMGL